ncbi:InlB B-repeat-containing protein, partial [Hungatella sp.]|uniref:InlB B-repeat-containing protein n=1 Tax=Hungatella sp. TaxID=2613924 RepID=UPI00399327EE
MKGLKKKLRRGLAGFLSFVLTMTSFNMVSWADVAAAFEKENATFVMSGEDLRDSAQAAIDNGDEFNFEDLGVDTSDRSLAKEYQRLFETGSVFEFAPAYDMDEEEYADGAELRMFIRINGDPEGYQITGDEDIIFLYINDSDARVTFRSRIDGYTTQKVTVKGNSTLLDAEAPTAPVGGEGNGNGAGNGAGGAGVNGGAGSEVQNPDGNAGGGDGAVDGTVQNPDGDANMGEAADGNGTTNGDVQNPDGNAGGAIDGEGAANGDVQNPDAGLDGENGNAANDVQNPDANVSDGNGTNDGTVQNPDTNADGENTDHSNTNTGKEEQVQKPEDHAGTNGGVQNSDTNKTEDGGKAEAGNSESGSSNSGASNSGASDSGSSNSGSSDSGSDQGDSLVSAATLNRHYTHILTTAVNGDAGSKESDKVSTDEGKEDKVDAADKTDKADNTDTSDKHDSEDVNSDTNTEDGSNGGNADKDAVVTPDGEEGNSAVEDNKADAVTPDNGENQDPSDDKAEDQGEVSKPDDGQGDAVIDDNSDKDNADKDNADKNAAEDNKADDTTVDGKDHAANGEDGKKNDSLVVDPEADEKEEVSKTGTTSGKTYGQVVLDESYYAKAYVTTLNKLHIDVSKEGYAVTYTVTPVGTAAVKGAKNVEEGKDLTFTVKPQVGYVIDHVTANGESLEAVEDDEATASNADTGVKRFVVPEIEEEQEIVVVMAEIGEHPEFNFSKTLGDVVVSLHAEEGILPAGTVAKVTEVTEKVEEAVKEKTAEETGEDTSANTVLAYDIKLFVENEAGELEALDNSWSDNGYVEVTFAGKAIEEKSAEAEKVEITHIDTGDVDATSESVEKVSVEEVEKVESVSDAVDVADNNSIEMIAFEAEHFSIYAIYFTNGGMAAKIRTMSIDGKSIGTNNYVGDWWNRFTLTTSGLMISNIAQDIKNNESEAFKSYKFVKATIGNQYDGESVLRIRQQGNKKYKLEYSLKDIGYSWQSFNSNEDLYFWFEPITITVTFDPNEDYGGTGEPFTVIVGDEGKIITPDNPFTNKNGYEFVGWHGEKSGHHSGTEMLQQTFIEGVQYPPNIDNKTNTITSDITLYATWLNKKGTDGQEAKFFIRTDGKAPFEPNGYGASDYYPSTSQTQLTGNLRNKIEINNNPEMVAANILKEPSGTAIAAAAKKAGKSFNPDTQKVLWYVIKDQGDWHVDGIVVDKNTYSVRYWPNGGNENVPPTQNYSEGTTVRVNYNNIPTRIGYEFLGWDTDKASTSPRYVSNGTNNSFVIKDANVDLYAIWKPKDGIPFTVEHYTQQLDKSYPQKTTDVATKYSTTGTIVKDDDYKKTMPGFTYVSGIVDNITEAEVQGDGSTVLKLYYTRNTDTPYTIEHYQQSVENPEEYKLVEIDTETGSGVTGEKASFTPKDYTNDGFEYNAALTMPEDRTITGDGKLVVKLYYDRKSYSVKYEYTGNVPDGVSSLPQTKTYRVGEDVTIAADAAAKGYSFSGWKINGKDAEMFKMPAHDIKITGSFGVNSYTVTYKVDNSTYGAVETYQYGENVSLREKPVKEGYSFKGWSRDSGFTMPAENVVIEGHFEINKYTVRYEVDGALYGEEESYDFGEMVEIRDEPTKDGYTFSHWSQKEAFSMPANDVVIKGNFSINSYKVTYKVDGVQYGDTETHEYGSAVTLRAEPETEGYTFSGWNRENNFTMPAEDVVIEGNFKINSYTVTYKVDGEISGEAETYKYGAVVTLREEPAKEGYTFSHWSRESGFTMPAENIVVEGHFEINSYTVTYKVDDQLYGKVDTYKFGEDVTLRDAPTKEGYTFSGWSETSGFKMPAKDVEIKGNFSINDYTVTYKVDGKVIDEKKHQYNEEVTVRADETKEGYTFSGWSSEDVRQSFIQRLLSSSIAGKTFRMPAKDVVIEGHFDINSYKVTYQVDGVQSGEIETYEYGTLVTIRDDLEKEGHKFSGWNLKEDFAMPAEDVVIVGSFTANEYTVTYLVDGKPYETAETYLYGTAVKLKEAPEKEGYTFSGWDHEEDFTMPAENVVINGSFSINSYKVTYEVDGSAYGKEETYQYGSAVTLQKEPEKEGYTFSKWDHEDGFAMPAHDVVIKGSFKINSYKVTYKVDGEQVGEAETYEFNAPVTLREAPEKEGYTFSGWSRDTGFNMPAKDVVIEGSFTINNYTVTYLVDGKQTGETETYQYNQEVTVKADAEREGYTFSGWSSEDVKENFIQKLLSNSIAGRTFHMPAKNVEIEGSFDINSYKVTYKVDGKPVGEVETYNYGTLVTVRQSPEKEGYTFSGWSRTEAFEMPARDIVIEGSYKINSYTVTYKVDGEQYGETETYEYGAAVTLREKPSREGYTFKGWSYENGFKMPAGDVVIEGSYKINSYTVTYKVDGQQYGEPEVYKYNELVRLKSEPTKEGYTFSHWNYGEDFRMPAKDVVIEGNFGINSYTVTYKVDGVQYGDTETHKYGSAVTLRAEPETEGYT